MRFYCLYVLLISTLSLSACGVINARSVYEGVRSSQKTQTTGMPAVAAPQPLPDYDQYEQDRQTLKKKAD
jgi:hypothetical protein